MNKHDAAGFNFVAGCIGAVIVNSILILWRPGSHYGSSNLVMAIPVCDEGGR